MKNIQKKRRRKSNPQKKEINENISQKQSKQAHSYKHISYVEGGITFQKPH